MGFCEMAIQKILIQLSFFEMVTESCDAVFFEGSRGCGDKCRRLNRTCPVRLLVQPLALNR